MEPNEITEEQQAKARECKTQEEPGDLAESADTPLNLDELDAVSGGAGRADFVEIDGQVTELFPNAMFQVQLDDGNSATCSISGRLRSNFIRIRLGDRVRVKMNPGDPSKGNIVWRYK